MNIGTSCQGAFLTQCKVQKYYLHYGVFIRCKMMEINERIRKRRLQAAVVWACQEEGRGRDAENGGGCVGSGRRLVQRLIKHGER